MMNIVHNLRALATTTPTALLLAGVAACDENDTKHEFSPADLPYSVELRQKHLEGLGVPHGGIIDAGYGSGLSFRDPDNLPLEFFAPPARPAR